MNEALQFHMITSLKNMVKRTLKRPLKTIGIILVFAYFLMIPLFTKNMIVDANLATPRGYVLLLSALNIYVTMPSSLTYFKRNGVVFRKQDVNFMLATPIGPKQILFYALFKQAFMSLLLNVVSIFAAVYIFTIPLTTALLYGITNLVLSSVMSYSLAIIMYGSERLSETVKIRIKWGVYAIMLFVSALIIFYFIQNGVSIASALELVHHPIILGVPFFGWELGYLNLLILGVTPTSLITAGLFIIASLTLGFTAYRMKSTGEFYEDALKFQNAKRELNQRTEMFLLRK